LIGGSGWQRLGCIDTFDLRIQILQSVFCTIVPVTIVIYDRSDSSLYYKHVMVVNNNSYSLAIVVNYDPRVMPQFETSLLRHHLRS
jgi:hypothetical protein